MKKSSWKFVIVIVLVFVLAAMLFNIDLPNENEEMQVTMIIKSKYGTQWELISKGAEAAANEYGAELSILAPDYERDFLAQQDLVEGAGSKQGGAVIIAPIIFSELQDTMSTLAAKGVPVMSIVSGQEASGIYSSLSTNYREVGTMLGESMEKLIGASGTVVFVATRNDEEAIDQKLLGLNQFIEMKTNMEVSEFLFAPGDPLSVQRVVENYLTNNDVDGIIALDGPSTIGTGMALEKLELNLGAIGCNIYEDDLYLLDDDIMDEVVVENFFALGYLAVENSVSKLKDKGAFSHKLITAHRVTKKNMYDEDIQKIIFPIK